MSPLFTYKGKLLVVDGKLANSQDCCCAECSYIEITYDWTFGGDVDLDTKTVFNGVSLGFDCLGGNCAEQGPPDCGDQYITWSGDNVEASGTETIIVRVRKALDDGIWNNQTSIELNAYWYEPAPGPQGGPTKIFIKLFSDTGRVCKEVCYITDDLPLLEGCANHLVGKIIVKEINNNITFDIECDSCKCNEPAAFGMVENPLINFGWTKPPTKDCGSITATFTFEDSGEEEGMCGTAINPGIQTGIGTCDFTLSENTQVTLNVSGNTEDQNPKFDYGWILIEGPGVPAPQVEKDGFEQNKTFHVRIRSTEEEKGCAMSPKSDQLQINIGPGTYTVTFQVDTVDGKWHENMVHNFSVTW
jgi:hypothetical protein